MTLLAGGSILAAFFAGSVALFSPCCIVFLLPAYLAAAVNGRRWAVFPLSLVFTAGLAAVMLPLTLGVGMLAATLTRFHTWLYLAGGLLMLGLGVLSVAGRSWSLPMGLRGPDPRRSDLPGVAALGVFSGIASSCCAPVLAGVLTLSALSGSPAGAVLLGGAYVFGMVMPLFLIALVWDRWRIGERRRAVNRPVAVSVWGRTLRTNVANLGVGLVFFAMGAGIMALAAAGNPAVTPGFQVAFGRLLTRTFERVLSVAKPVPEPLLAALVVGLAAVVVAAGWRGARGRATDADVDDTDDRAAPEECHGTDEHSGAPEETRAGARPTESPRA